MKRGWMGWLAWTLCLAMGASAGELTPEARTLMQQLADIHTGFSEGSVVMMRYQVSFDDAEAARAWFDSVEGDAPMDVLATVEAGEAGVSAEWARVEYAWSGLDADGMSPQRGRYSEKVLGWIAEENGEDDAFRTQRVVERHIVETGDAIQSRVIRAADRVAGVTPEVETRPVPDGEAGWSLIPPLFEDLYHLMFPWVLALQAGASENQRIFVDEEDETTKLIYRITYPEEETRQQWDVVNRFEWKNDGIELRRVASIVDDRTVADFVYGAFQPLESGVRVPFFRKAVDHLNVTVQFVQQWSSEVGDDALAMPGVE